MFVIDRTSVKLQSKEIIRGSSPNMILAGLLVTLLGALISWLCLRLTGVDMSSLTAIMEAMSAGDAELANRLLVRVTPGTRETLLDFLLRLALRIVEVGFVIFTLNTIRRNGAVLGNLLDGFGMMPRVLWLILLESIFVALWSALFVIPGIIAAYRYSLAVYIMIDNPEMGAMDCLRESKKMTLGYKGQLFELDLSFLLWILLSTLPVVGYAAQIYVTPYRETARALYYEQIREQNTRKQIL